VGPLESSGRVDEVMLMQAFRDSSISDQAQMPQSQRGIRVGNSVLFSTLSSFVEAVLQGRLHWL